MAGDGSERLPLIFKGLGTPHSVSMRAKQHQEGPQPINIWGKCVFPTLELSVVLSPHTLIVSSVAPSAADGTWKGQALVLARGLTWAVS